MTIKNLFVLAALVLATTASWAADPKFNSTVPAALQQQILHDLDFVQSIKGRASTVFYKKIFGQDNVSGLNLMDFFSHRITEFNMSDCGGGEGVAACVQPMINSYTMW